MSKNKLNTGIFAQNEYLFRCPLCYERMKLINLKSLICTNQHCFDISKQGYINMLSRATQTKYNSQMFESRRTICRTDFFLPMIKKISRIIMSNSECQNKQIKILDVGCGEGSNLSMIQEIVSQNIEKDLLGVGLDISKEGICLASKEYPNTIWCVGDLAKAPLADNQFNFILNILTPANYSEFKRMISPGGMVIKVIPERGYLQEIRDVFYEHTDKQVYSNDKTIELFRNKFNLVEIDRLRYIVNLDHTQIESLIQMTPLSWGATKERFQKALEMTLSEVTVDLTILVGKIA
ncbi:hypothetical protein JCM14036_16980 [Desulfotomaculum defluvii]